MAGWLRGWLKRDQRSSRLAALLVDYPAYEIPHPGAARALKVAQCQENLRYFLDQRERRLTVFATLLRTFDIDLRTGLDATDPKPLLDALDRWARTEWPGIAIEGIGDPTRWCGSSKDGLDIALSMLMDMAIVLGEVVVRRRADFAWQLDLDPGDKGMLSYRRVVVMRPADPAMPWAATVFDFERECIGRFEQIGRGDVLDGALGDTALSALAGGYDPVVTPAKPGVAAPAASFVYDKADYHDESVREYGLPPERAATPGAFFLGWLMDRELCSASFAKRESARIAAYRRRSTTPLEIYDAADRSLIDTMLGDAANAFAKTYFADGGKAFWNDYDDVLASGLPSPFHVAYDTGRQERIDIRLDERYAEWESVR